MLSVPLGSCGSRGDTCCVGEGVGSLLGIFGRRAQRRWGGGVHLGQAGVAGHVIPQGCPSRNSPGWASGVCLLGGGGGCRGLLAGAFAGPVGRAVDEDLVAGVDEPVEQ